MMTTSLMQNIQKNNLEGSLIEIDEVENQPRLFFYVIN